MADKFWNRKSGKYEVICCAPSVNLTQMGNAIVPVPYPVNEKMGGSKNVTDKGGKKVKINGKYAYHHASNSNEVSGDGKGSKKGVKSGTVEGKSEPIKATASKSVKTNKKFIVREGDLQKMQSGNTIGKITCKESGSTSTIKDTGEIEGDTLPPDMDAGAANAAWAELG